MKEIYVGKIVNYFGLKGELKVVSTFEMANKAFMINNHLLINHESHLITGVRYHHFNYLIKIDNLNDINLITKYIGNDLYINREELHLKDSEYLLNDLLNLEVYDQDNFIGKVSSIKDNQINPLIKVNNFYLPLKSNYLVSVDLKNNRINVKDSKGLML